MRTRTCFIALLLLVCLLATTILVSASEDDCWDCEDKQSPESTGFQKLYCKILDIRESDLYNKVTLKVETRTNPVSSPLYISFYNTSSYVTQRLNDWTEEVKYSNTPWVNIFYTSNASGVCHILLVEQVEQTISPVISFLLIFAFLIIGIFVGAMFFG
jgi:hypothetical protein